MKIQLDDKRALVTGGNSGIGAAVVEALAEAGAKVAINYVTHPEAAQALVHRIRATGGEALAIQADVSDANAVAGMFSQVDEAWGGIDILVNSAGIDGPRALAWEAEVTAWRKVIEVNLLGAYCCAQQALRRMARQKGGVILRTSSVHEVVAWGGYSAYTASKAGLAVFQQITGINTVIHYAPMIFQFAGFESASASILATVGVGAVNVAMTVVALLLVDRVGRRPLLLAGLAGMVAGLGALGLAFSLPQLPGPRGWLAAGSLTLYVGAFAVGLGPVFWLLISEIYPLKTRGLAMSVETAANWGANLLVALTFLTLFQTVGRAPTFWLYALVGIGAWLFAWFFVPETKGRSLEEIEAHWTAGKHPREMGRQPPRANSLGREAP